MSIVIPDDIKSEFTVKPDGTTTATRRAIARLTGVDEKAIRYLLDKIAAEQTQTEIFKPFEGWTFKGAEQIPDVLVSAIVEYYAYEAQDRYRKEQAKQVCRAFRAIGFRVWVQNQLGWQKSQPKNTRHYLERVKLSIEGGSQLPDGYWCVLHESVRILFFVEEILSCPVDHADLLDGSIGKMWSKYRSDKEWAGDRVKFNYKFPDGRHCNPWCYRMIELGYFVDWVNKQYQPNHLPKYLEKKYGAIVKA